MNEKKPAKIPMKELLQASYPNDPIYFGIFNF